MNNLNFNNNSKRIKRQPLQRSWKFWLVFWSISISFLFGWFIFWEYKNSDWIRLANILSPVLKIAPIEDKQKEELQSIFKIANLLKETQEIQTFLILFQNNMELRPGGGYIGSFGILKLKKGQVIEIDVHDTNVFDSRSSTEVIPPYPMGETLAIKHWEMRDSNWFPDFPTNAKKAIEFYQYQGGSENFNGVIAVSTELLNSFLEFTGPVSLNGYPGEYNNKNAITKLEYQVEKGYKEQNIEKGKRKYVMKYLAKEILRKVQNLNLTEKKNLLLRLEDHLDQKDIMLNFSNPKIQDEIVKMDWDGEVIEDAPKDYLMIVDANLASYKTDPHIIRMFKYQVDFRPEKPLAKLEVTYTNSAKVKDWMTNDYQSFLRIYTPIESWLLESNNHHPVKFTEEFNKKTFGTLVQIPINQTKTYWFEYQLPERISFEDYNLIIQKQSGINEIKGEIKFINKNGQVWSKTIASKEDWALK